MAKSPLTKKYDLSSVIDIGSGAAPLSGDVIEQYEKLWPEGDRKLNVRPFRTQLAKSIRRY
jgi:4-coumarate--CoA ligase